ncbi:MAG: transporter substrate-binding domain-containing protein [Desulfobacterales bacterium]|nr:transporter substrate-binding domain-containing protein [Desulfobacterales bacterium]
MQGIAVDLLVLMLERVGSKQGRQDIKMYPWARAYNYAQDIKNTILFSTTRTEEREKIFKWVGPIFTNNMCLIARKDSHIKANTFEEMKNYRIGTVIDDVSEQLLVKEGFSIDILKRNILGINNITKL